MENQSLYRGEKGVVSIDNGGCTTRIVMADFFIKFPSSKGSTYDLNLRNVRNKHDYVVEYKGRRWFAGTLAQEGDLPMQMHTETKQNDFYDISTLLALHQFGYHRNHLIITSPITSYTKKELEGLRGRLVRSHEFIVNGLKKEIIIESISLNPEAVSAFFVNEPEGTARWVSFGSRHINWGTTVNQGGQMRFVGKESGTEKKGLEVISEKDVPALVDYICGKVSAKWNENDKVYLLGGGAVYRPEIFDMFKNYFPNTSICENPEFAEAIGGYIQGKKALNLD